MIQASSMTITSKCKIALRPGTMFCFGTISSIADEEGTLHRVADPSEKKLSSEILRGARAEQRVALPLTPRGKMTPYKPKVGSLPTQKTPLSTSPTKEWTWITRKKEANVPSQGREHTESSFRHLRPQRRTKRKVPSRQLLSTPTSSSSGGYLSRLPSQMTSVFGAPHGAFG